MSKHKQKAYRAAESRQTATKKQRKLAFMTIFIKGKQLVASAG